MNNIIFIFSLPRSGSTLLQKMLGRHSKIATVSEPWLLLPLLCSQEKDYLMAKYNHEIYLSAFEDLVSNLPNQKDDYNASLARFIKDLYNLLCKDKEIYFLDKTPRYYLIIPKIEELFPNGKFIFLFRNPLQIYASMINTWGEGNLLHLHGFNTEMKDGPILLATAYESIKEKAIKLNYDELMEDTHSVLENICDYLEIEYEKNMIIDWKDTELKGSLGDKDGVNKYSNVELTSRDIWKNTFSTWYRKRLIRKYIYDLPDHVLACFGHQKMDILNDIDKLESKMRLMDFWERFLSYCYKKLFLKYFIREKYRSLLRNML